MKKADSTISQIRIIYMLTSLLLVSLSIYSYMQMRNLHEASGLVNHTNKVTLTLQKITIAVVDAESNKRAFMISGDSSLLKKRQDALDTLNMQRRSLSDLISDNAEQVQNLKALNSTIDEKIINVGDISSANAPTNITRGVKLTERVKQDIGLMAAKENELLELRTKQYDYLSFLTPVFVIVLFLMALLILLWSYNKINNTLHSLQKSQAQFEEANRQLNRQNEELAQSEERFFRIFDTNPVAMTFGEIGSNKVIYANNLFYTTFGYSKEEVIGHTSEELKLTSDEENARLIPIILSYLEEGVTVESLQALPPEETAKVLITLREKMFKTGFEVLYTRKNGETFYAIVYFEVTKIGNKQYAITSYQDISERKKAENTLIRMNKELESFNYIASHDLQEPLRKIQTLVGYLFEKESDRLSDNGRKYFGRIQSAADRMQQLIKDLLSYSRMELSENKFEYTDLNLITEEIREDFREEFLQKNATFETGEMCSCNIIPFQFRQLLYNLVSNALKFSKSDVPPHITIKSEILKGNKLNHPKLQPDQEYCHIMVKDNGIGFEQEYENRIFELFQRLNSKDNFPGTGIGLSIAKKIVENHGGFIAAASKPDEGARFDIYFPTNAGTRN